jgi:hypothetical protein
MFAMDIIAKAISALVILLLGLCLFLGIKVFVLQFEIRELNTTVAELSQEVELCKYEAVKLGDSNNFLKEKLHLLDAYYRQKPKPPVTAGDTFNKDNLFMADPR